MPKSLIYLADNLIVSPESDRRQLPLNHPDAKCIREKDVTLASLCDLKGKCEVYRNDPSVHILIFSIEGNGMLYAADYLKKGRPIESGQVVILPAHHRHRYKMTSSRWKAIWFYLADTYTWHHLRDTKPLIRISLVCNELKSAVEGFLAENLRTENRARLAAHHYAELIVLNLERELDMEETPIHKEMKQRLYKLWDTVSGNLNDEWTVSKMAENVGISPQHLYKVSVQFCGHKPMEMVARLRMQQAQEYLISTDYMIKSIARLLGYSDSFSFSAAFKRHIGTSPKQFRDKHIKQQEEEKREDGWY